MFKGKIMNERIKEIALEAFMPINDIASEGVADYHTFKQPWFQLYNQKFAELIIAECIDICIEGNATQMTSDGAAQFIKLRFGIE
jgi:hypothetical protein